MNVRMIVCLIQVFLLLCPLSQAWSQPLEEQAQYYLQQVGPVPPSARPLPVPAPPVSTAPEGPRAESIQAAPAPGFGPRAKTLGWFLTQLVDPSDQELAP